MLRASSATNATMMPMIHVFVNEAWLCGHANAEMNNQSPSKMFA